MQPPLYVDLLITDDDITMNRALALEHATDRTVIAQDIVHSIRESGVALELVGQRDPIIRQKILTDIELLVEEDARLVPGTVTVLLRDVEHIIVIADTREFNKFEDKHGL